MRTYTDMSNAELINETVYDPYAREELMERYQSIDKTAMDAARAHSAMVQQLERARYEKFMLWISTAVMFIWIVIALALGSDRCTF